MYMLIMIVILTLIIILIISVIIIINIIINDTNKHIYIYGFGAFSGPPRFGSLVKCY